MAKAVSMRLLIFVLVWPLLSTSVFASDRGTNSTPEATQANDFYLSGILISAKGRSALINNQIAREGDRVAGAKILSIDVGEVRILMGSRLATVRVGSKAAWANDARADDARADDRTGTYGPVRRGETLSEIAESHRVSDITLNQLMIALFEANPTAFDNNINRLREGATLRIPGEDAFRRLAAKNATVEVERHMNVWRPGNSERQQPVRVAKAVERATYGPVTRGETLSGIAAQLPKNGVTLSQTIDALFHANTEAFGGNIDVLHEGAVLHIPEELNLPTIDPGILPGGIIVSMNSRE